MPHAELLFQYTIFYPASQDILQIKRRTERNNQLIPGVTEEKEGHSKGITPNVVLYLFNEEQKKAVGGYDAYVVLWSKITYNTEDMVKRLSKKTENVRY